MEPEAEGRHGPLDQILDTQLEAVFETIQRLLIAAVALALIVLSGLALWDTVVSVQSELSHGNLTLGIATGVDTAFLTVILLELLHTVTSRGPVAQQVQEFIVIGITSAVRHGLGIAAAASGTNTARVGASAHGLSERDTVTNLAINSVSVLLLVGALWLVRHRFDVGGAPEA